MTIWYIIYNLEESDLFLKIISHDINFSLLTEDECLGRWMFRNRIKDWQMGRGEIITEYP